MTTNKLTLNLEIPLTPAFSTPYITLNETRLPINIELQEGSHTFVSQPVEVGNALVVNSGKLYALFSFWYELDLKNQVLTLCSSDHISETAPYIALRNENSDGMSYQYAYTARNGKTSDNQDWTHESKLYGELSEQLYTMLRNSNQQIIEKCLELGLTLAVRTPVPEMDLEEYKKYFTVYKDGLFVEFYDPSKEYGEEYTIHELKSSWGGQVTFTSGENFANVIGSTGDPKVASLSWIQLWQQQYGVATTCTSYNYGGFKCSGSLLGGHVITGKVATKVPYGVNYVYIMPICSGHNNNNSVYMAALQYTKGVWLKNYHK